MAAASKARKNVQYDGPDWIGPVGIKNGSTIYHGTMVGLNTTGNQAVPATTSIAPIGVADLQAWDDLDKTGQASTFAETTDQYRTATSDGSRMCVLRQGVFKMNNKAGDLVTQAHIGLAVYVEDDQTVRATAAGTVAAGKLVQFDDRDGLPLVAIGFGGQYGAV